MTEVGEFPLQRSDGTYDDVTLYEPGTFAEQPLLLQLSDGTWGAPYLEPLGDGDTGLLVQKSDGTWLQARRVGVRVIEDWETGDKRNWGYNGGGTVTSARAYEGTYSYRGDAGGGHQVVRDNEKDHNNLPYYQQPGDEVRLFGWYGSTPNSGGPNLKFRWGFGGIFEDSTDGAWYAQWDINNSSLRLIDSDGHTSAASTFSFSYPGSVWWALEVDWQDPTITLRLVDYSDPANPTLQDSVSVDDTRYNGNTYRGHQWFVWNDESAHLYGDKAAVQP